MMQNCTKESHQARVKSFKLTGSEVDFSLFFRAVSSEFRFEMELKQGVAECNLEAGKKM